MMEMTYQLIDQIAAAGTTGQTGAKRDAGTQDKSDGGFDTMVRQKREEAAGTTETAETRSGTPAAEAEAEKTPVTDEDRIAMAAAMLLQPQPEIVYVQDTPVPAEEIGTEAVSELLPEQAAETAELLPEQAETIELPEQRAAETAELPEPVFTERPAEAAAQDTHQTAETARFQPVETDSAAAEGAVTEKVGPDRQSDGAELPADPREGENEALAEAPVLETPVFGYMDATPFKVAASETERQPIELEAADAAEELGARIEKALTDEAGDTRVELSLNPASLGKLTVEITHRADGSLHIQLFAATEKAAALLEKNASGLQSLLAAKERPQTTVEVRVGESARQFLDPNGQRQNQNGAYQQQQQQQRRPQREALRVEDFMSRLRLGLVDLDAAM